MDILSILAWNGHEMLSLKIMAKFMTKKGLCQLKTDTCHLPLQGLNHVLLQLLTFNTPWKEFRVEIRNEALCALGKTGRTGLQIDIFRRFYESQFLHLLIPRETLTLLMVTSALAIKENFTIKSQNRVAMVQTSWEITGWCYGCTFRLDLVLLNTWVFWIMSGLDATILKTMSAGS